MLITKTRPRPSAEQRERRDPSVATCMRSISLKEFLRWAYNRQQVDTLTGKLIDGDQQAFTVGEGSEIVSRFSALGTHIDNGGSTRFARNDVHPDAELLHDRVLELGAIDARLVIQFGHTGWFPEPQAPSCFPAPPAKGDLYKMVTWQGEERRCKVKVAGRVDEIKEVWEHDGRKGARLAYVEHHPQDVFVWLFEYHPDPRWCAATQDIAAHWAGVMAALKASIRAMLAGPEFIADSDGGQRQRFIEHEIADLEKE